MCWVLGAGCLEECTTSRKISIAQCIFPVRNAQNRHHQTEIYESKEDNIFPTLHQFRQEIDIVKSIHFPSINATQPNQYGGHNIPNRFTLLHKPRPAGVMVAHPFPVPPLNLRTNQWKTRKSFFLFFTPSTEGCRFESCVGRCFFFLFFFFFFFLHLFFIHCFGWMDISVWNSPLLVSP